MGGRGENDAIVTEASRPRAFYIPEAGGSISIYPA